MEEIHGDRSTTDYFGPSSGGGGLFWVPKIGGDPWN